MFEHLRYATDFKYNVAIILEQAGSNFGKLGYTFTNKPVYETSTSSRRFRYAICRMQCR